MASTDAEHRPLWFDDPDDFARFRGLLDRVEFTDHGVAAALELDAARSVAQGDVPTLLLQTEAPTPLNTLIRLFLIGTSADLKATEQAVAPMELRQWVDAGLLQVDGDAVSATVKLLPFQDLRMAFDLPPRPGIGLSADYVMGIGSSTLTLANLTVRRESRLTLDLGTGCGLLALLAARHSQRVLAVDRNPRAVAMAEFNVRINGLSQVECLHGDLFEPVAGRQFDLVVTNPPFVISPESRYIYRDSGVKGDQISHKIVRQVAAFLSEGGYCQILCNWAHLRDQPWEERLAAWFDGTGCDAWVMRSDTLDAAGYASKWIRHTERDDTEQFQQRFREWMEYYRREQIEAVSGGLITMHRRGGAANWFRADDGPEKMLGPAGDGVALGFRLRDFLEAHDDQQLLASRMRVSTDVQLHQRFEVLPDGWSPVESELQLGRGLAYSGRVDPYMARLLAGCNGHRPLKQLLDEMAAAVDQPAAELAPTLLAVIRRLIERGFVLPPEDGEPA